MTNYVPQQDLLFLQGSKVSKDGNHWFKYRFLKIILTYLLMVPE